MEAKKQIEIARAKLKVYQEVQEFEDDMDSVEDDHLQTSPIQINLEIQEASVIPPQEPKYSVPDANTSNSTAQSALQPQDVHPVGSEATHPAHAQSQKSPANEDTVTSIVTAIADSFSMSRLPAPEPTIFSGEPILYPD